MVRWKVAWADAGDPKIHRVHVPSAGEGLQAAALETGETPVHALHARQQMGRTEADCWRAGVVLHAYPNRRQVLGISVVGAHVCLDGSQVPVSLG